MLPTIHTKRRRIRCFCAWGVAGILSLTGCILPIAGVNVEKGEGQDKRPNPIMWDDFALLRETPKYFLSDFGVQSRAGGYRFDECLKRVADAIHEARPGAGLYDAELLWKAVFPDLFFLSAPILSRHEKAFEAIEALGIQYLIVVDVWARSYDRKGGLVGGGIGGVWGITWYRESVLASAALLEADPDGQRQSFFACSDAPEAAAAYAFVPLMLWAPGLAKKACRALGDEVAKSLPQDYRGEPLGVVVVAGSHGAWRGPPEEDAQSEVSDEGWRPEPPEPHFEPIEPGPGEPGYRGPTPLNVPQEKSE